MPQLIQPPPLANAFRVLAASAVAIPKTGGTNETALATIPIPAGDMGANGILRVTPVWSAGANNANAKTFRIRLGGISGAVLVSGSLASTISFQHVLLTRNRGAQNSQLNFSNFSTSGSAAPTSAVDTSVAQDLVFTAQLGSGSDTMTLEGYLVEILYKA